jgi:hypothetical protein
MVRDLQIAQENALHALQADAPGEDDEDDGFYYADDEDFYTDGIAKPC